MPPIEGHEIDRRNRRKIENYILSDPLISWLFPTEVGMVFVLGFRIFLKMRYSVFKELCSFGKIDGMRGAGSRFLEPYSNTAEEMCGTRNEADRDFDKLHPERKMPGL